MTDVDGTLDGPRHSVVLVDDSSEVRALVRRRLEKSGFFEIVGEGGDGDEALGLAYRHEPALMLLDASMPKADGVEALPGILALSPETTVVMFTGFEERGLAARAREFGAADFIEKSIRLEDLPERLLRALDSTHAGAASARHPLSVVRDGPPGALSEFAQEQSVLDEHRERFRELVDQAAIGMATLTVTGTVVRANRALAELMQCRPYDLVGVDYGRLTVGRGEMLDRALEVISSPGEDVATFEHLLPAAEGEEPTRTVRVTLAPVRDPQERLLYVFAQVQDLSAQRTAEGELRRSEEYFRLLVSAVEEYAIFMLDVDGKVSSWNAGAQRIKGYAASEIVGRHFRAFYPPEEQATGHPQRNLEAARRDGSFAEEGWRVRKDGSRFWASVVITAVYDDTRRHVGFAKVTRDQTEQLNRDEERRSASVQQSQLLAVTAHELRTPTAVIDGAAGALRESWDQMPTRERDELLEKIRSSAHRLHRFASDLSMASRFLGGSLELRLDDEPLSHALRSAVARRQTTEPGVRIDLDIPRDVMVRVDEVRLAQALDNLLANAVRHGAAPVTLHGHTTDDEILIRVSDAGPGVPPEVVPQLFEPFSSAGSSGGTGLGLYLVREIARGHAGEVSYHPPGPTEQTGFELRLPRHP